MIFKGAIFVMKDSCLVSRIVTFDAIPVQRYSHIIGVIKVPFKSYLNQCF